MQSIKEIEEKKEKNNNFHDYNMIAKPLIIWCNT